MEQLISDINSVASRVNTASAAMSTPVPSPHPHHDDYTDDDDGPLDRGEVEPVISPLGLLLGYKKRLSDTSGGGKSGGELRRAPGRATWSSGFTPIGTSVQPRAGVGAGVGAESYAEGPPPHESTSLASRARVIGGRRHASESLAVLHGTPVGAATAAGRSWVGDSDLDGKLDRLRNLSTVLFIRVTEAQRLHESALGAAVEVGNALHETSSCSRSDIDPQVALAEGANEECTGTLP
jgi:hypothetical protein